jgi:hypothetical protein
MGIGLFSLIVAAAVRPDLLFVLIRSVSFHALSEAVAFGEPAKQATS